MNIFEKINKGMIEFRRNFKEWPNTLIVGCQENQMIIEEAKETTEEKVAFSVENVFSWNMQIEKVDIESYFKICKTVLSKEKLIQKD